VPVSGAGASNLQEVFFQRLQERDEQQRREQQERDEQQRREQQERDEQQRREQQERDERLRKEQLLLLRHFTRPENPWAWMAGTSAGSETSISTDNSF